MAGALNDQIAVAEADRGADAALLVPEGGDLLIQRARHEERLSRAA